MEKRERGSDEQTTWSESPGGHGQVLTAQVGNGMAASKT